MNNLKKAYELGWIQASKWAEREDLIADIGSPAYVREADAALADQQPQVAIKQPQAEPLESLLSIATGLLIGYEDSDGQEARKPYKPGSAIANFVDECVERLKDWPTALTQQPQTEAVRDAMRYRKLRGWMSGNVKESWQEVENMGALCAWESWDAMDEYLDSLSECNIGLMEKAPEQAAPKQSRADLEAENERLKERLEEMVNTFCSVENVANEHYLQVLRDAIAALKSTK